MTGLLEVFLELDRAIRGTVRFRDGSVVQIEGRGTVLFIVGAGEHHVFQGVYYILRLTVNLISLGQLDPAP